MTNRNRNRNATAIATEPTAATVETEPTAATVETPAVDATEPNAPAGDAVDATEPTPDGATVEPNAPDADATDATADADETPPDADALAGLIERVRADAFAAGLAAAAAVAPVRAPRAPTPPRARIAYADPAFVRGYFAATGANRKSIADAIGIGVGTIATVQNPAGDRWGVGIFDVRRAIVAPAFASTAIAAPVDPRTDRPGDVATFAAGVAAFHADVARIADPSVAIVATIPEPVATP